MEMEINLNKVCLQNEECEQNRVPSGKGLHNYGKSPFLMGKLTINGNFQWLCNKLQRVFGDAVGVALGIFHQFVWQGFFKMPARWFFYHGKN